MLRLLPLLALLVAGCLTGCRASANHITSEPTPNTTPCPLAVAGQRIGDPAYTGAATTAAEHIRESILAPQRCLVPGYELVSQPMPAQEIRMRRGRNP